MVEIREHYSCLFAKIFSEQPRGDIESINRLLAQLSEFPKQLDELKIKKLICQPNFFLLTARAPNGNIVGMASLVIHEISMKKIGVIKDVVVDQNHKGRGIDKDLIKILIINAWRLGVYRIDLIGNPDRTETDKFYSDLGFQKQDSNFYRQIL